MLPNICEGSKQSDSWKCISDSCQIEKNVIVVTVFLLIMSQTEFHLVPNQKENCHYDPFPFSSGSTNLFPCVCQ